MSNPIRPTGLYGVALEDPQPFRDTQQEYGQIDPAAPQVIEGDEFAYSGAELLKSIANVQANPTAQWFGVNPTDGMVIVPVDLPADAEPEEQEVVEREFTYLLSRAAVEEILQLPSTGAP